jgi:uncharacterized OB-fold protein
MNTASFLPHAVSLPGDALTTNAQGQPALVGCVCATCGSRMFPRAPVCPVCISETMTDETMPSQGSLYSFTTVHVGPSEWQKPFTVGYVDLDNGVRVFSHLRGKNFQINQPVQLAVAEIGKTPDGKPIITSVFEQAQT